MIPMDVVIPVRDVDDYLGEAIDSALAQEGVAVRVVVVDGGSVEPIVLAPRHADRGDVRLIRVETPLTAGGGRNVGAAAGSAPWLTFLDADDIWPPSSRRALLDACEREDASLAAGMMTHFHADRAAERIRRPDGEQRALVAGGVILTRTSWAQVGPFDESLRSGEFIEWYNRFRLLGQPSASIPDVVLRRRLHVRSTTANQVGDRDDYLEVVRRWMNRTDS